MIESRTYPVAAGQSYCVENVAARLIKAGQRTDSIGTGIRGLLWILSSVKRPQICCDSRWTYVEVCQSYLATVDGVSRWSAKQGWNAGIKILKAVQLSKEVAAKIGIYPAKTNGKRHGGFILVKPRLVDQIDQAYQALVAEGLINRPDIRAHHWKTISLSKMPQPGRTRAVSCPDTHAHKNGDRHPSLVLWMNQDQKSGGAFCMTCKKPWSVKYDRSKASLFFPHGKEILRSADFLCNKDPLISPNELGGMFCTKSKSQYTKHLGGTLRGFYGNEGERRQSRKLSGSFDNVIQNLKWHEQRSSGRAATERALAVSSLAESEDVFSNLYLWMPICSVSDMRACAWDGKRPTDWKPVRQSWVLFDLDGVENIPDNAGNLLGELVQNEKHLSGDVAIVRTGPVGLQVWAKLVKPRYLPAIWHRLPVVVEWYSQVGNRMLDVLHRNGATNGTVDMACCSAGRFGRRPGWRLLADGTPFRSSLLFAYEVESKPKELIKIPVLVKGDSESHKIHFTNACGLRSRPSSSLGLKKPTIPDRTEVSPRQNPSSVRLMMSKKDSAHPSLALPVIKPPSLMGVQVLKAPSVRLAFFSFKHDCYSIAEQKVVWRPLFLIDGQELPRSNATQDPHRRWRSNDYSTPLSFVSGMEEFKILFPGFASVRVRHQSCSPTSPIRITDEPP